MSALTMAVRSANFFGVDGVVAVPGPWLGGPENGGEEKYPEDGDDEDGAGIPETLHAISFPALESLILKRYLPIADF
jgi:hypothetical protein